MRACQEGCPNPRREVHGQHPFVNCGLSSWYAYSVYIYVCMYIYIYMYIYICIYTYIYIDCPDFKSSKAMSESRQGSKNSVYSISFLPTIDNPPIYIHHLSFFLTKKSIQDVLRWLWATTSDNISLGIPNEFCGDTLSPSGERKSLVLENPVHPEFFQPNSDCSALKFLWRWRLLLTSKPHLCISP